MHFISRTFLCLFALLLLHTGYTQVLTQTVRGTVTDKVSLSPIPGVVVYVLNSNPKLSTVTDEDGNFKLSNVLAGKQTLVFNMVGYKPLTIPNLNVNTGKEVVLTINMEEEITETEEVVIQAKPEKNKALNDMSVVSTRTFSVEETQKYAAAVNDPARMAMAFAGVVQGNDGSNLISIRGNSPNGLVWRMEGVDIPNPNHFSSVGTSGGAISILSSQLLSNSDFSTGAFAAEYGNALSGVFDLKLRKGNNEKREYTFQAGVLGIDAAVEGPFKKGYGGSYLINYRYSTLGILSKIGVAVGDGVTTFQDLSYNIYLPTKKAGNFSLFGFGGLSSQVFEADKDTSTWTTDYYNRLSGTFIANTGASGITHTLMLNPKSYVKTALVFSGTRNSYIENEMDYNFNSTVRYKDKFLQSKLTFSTQYNYKVNAKFNVRTGIIANQLNYKLQQYFTDSTKQLKEEINQNGTTYSIQAYIQSKYRITEKFALVSGIHYLHFLLNNSVSVEPRAAFSYDISPKHTIGLGYGLHGQLLPLGVYFAKTQTSNTTFTLPNKNLGLSKAHHFVLSYNSMITQKFRLKTEVYYQHLFNIGQEAVFKNNFSVLNEIAGFNATTLNNNGKGKNYGIELTAEQFMHRNFYLLISSSLYQSKFKGTDGNWYNTRFNTNYAFSITTGKEFELSEKRKKRVLGVNIKALYTGGLRETPIDLTASQTNGYVTLNTAQMFTTQLPAYFRTDLRISIKRNYKKATGTLALDLQNVSNRKNVGGISYDSKTYEKEYWYQAPLIPILSYKLEF